jgi:hypothetical protein
MATDTPIFRPSRFFAMIGLCGTILAATTAQGGAQMIEDFAGKPAARWEFISDQVMGGLSTGNLTLEREGEQAILHLQGTVSTKNNGGFIQARLKLPERLPKSAIGLELRVKGNGQAYYIHARTGGTILPWNFYQAAFDVTPEWTVVRIPFADFNAQGRLLRGTFAADAVKSIAVVSYGRDQTADVSVASIGYY